MKKIKFVIRPGFEGFDKVKNSLPKESKNITPQWYKDMPSSISKNKFVPDVKTAKMCPSFSDIYNEGFVIVAPCDFVLGYDSFTNEYKWETSSKKFNLEIHGNDQLVNYANSDVKMIFKIQLPYYAIVPKGYSFRQIPLFYEFNKDWQVAYGTYKADKVPEITLQIMYTSNKKEILIKQGTPLCQMIPYKREKFFMKILKHKPKYFEKANAGLLKAAVKFKHSHLRNGY